MTSTRVIAFGCAAVSAVLGSYSLAVGAWQIGGWQLVAALWAFNTFIAERPR